MSVKRAIADDGFKIAYDTFGKRDGTPLLLIQGLGTDSRGWALQRMAFGRQYRCVAPDNRGVGGTSGAPHPLSLDRMAHDAVAVLDAEGVDPAHVQGASMGGAIAQIIGVLHPDRVRSLVLACTACRHHDWRRELLKSGPRRVERDGMAALAEEGMRWLVGPRLQRRFGVWINLLARVLMQAKPGGLRRAGASDPRRQRRRTLPARDDRRADARDHRLAGPAHSARRRRRARRAHPELAALRAARRRTRPHGRVAERVQRRGPRLPPFVEADVTAPATASA